jgi:hypothetical protein
MDTDIDQNKNRRQQMNIVVVPIDFAIVELLENEITLSVNDHYWMTQRRSER